MTLATRTQHTTGATAHTAGASSGRAASSWRTAAISEAALLAALALGSALLLHARRRTPRLGTWATHLRGVAQRGLAPQPVTRNATTARQEAGTSGVGASHGAGQRSPTSD